MTDVVPSTSKTIEINDAVFCLGHFKEVVRFRYTLPLPIIDIDQYYTDFPLDFSPDFDYIFDSAPTAMSTCGRRMMAFSGYAFPSYFLFS